MKKFILIVVMSVISLMTFAQKASGSFKSLAEVGRVSIVVDFSEASIMGMNENDFAEYERDWMKDKTEIVGRFVGSIQRKLGTMVVLDNSLNENERITIQVLVFTHKGDCVCDVILTDKENNELGRISKVGASGGHFGTKLNLIKDGAEHTGSAIGRLLYKLSNKEN